jgi:hypothetical protein
MPMPRPARRAIAVTMLAAGLALPAGAAAQDAPTREIDHVGALKECRAITDPAQRLACYDGAVAQVVTATDAGDLRFVDREDMRQTRRRLFGFSLPNLGIFGGGDDDDDEAEEQMDMLESRITSVRYLTPNSFTFRIEDGDAMWQVNEAPSRLREVRAGAPVVFKRATLGSYFIRIDGQIGVKGRRVQ